MGWFDGKSSSSGYYVRRRSPSRRSTYSTHHARRPRSGFVHRVVRYIKRLLRDIYDYARRHPFKVLIMVVIPLLTSGVLQKLLGMIGIRIPKSLGGLAGSGGLGGHGGHGGHGSRGGENTMADNLKGLMSVAKMFM
ncbi:hypothetical protein P168DRAFT_150435 [Aspergillus campestris IBT 28561]|uniref:Uncharacterized protein n=1 Tax=Aspergillus campestris (strain IBT 28561) TaxID=1392248 RepID=A0A2I1D2A8_ASPC2|nr:uncharacterized protein P168DRAFT_150435 [Aspergillus campestris IBT 28561]PKY04020.1 hypothetical protein P168DRAFT_150435 [Aspergillus campestris IBT 28561]